MAGKPKLSKLSDEAIAVAEQILHMASRQGRWMLFEHEVYTILAAMGLTVPIHVVVTDQSQITDALLAQFRTRKVVLKAIAGQVSHKEGVGGVRVVSKHPERVREGFEQMTRNFRDQGIRVQGVLLVQWISYSRELGNEVLLGFRESETFGPVISLSKGGTDAEHFANHFSPPNLILAPIDGRWARALLESTHIYQKYVGRGLSHYVERTVDAAVRFSDLALSFSNYFDNHTRFAITEFEVNPFVFTPDRRFVALDGLARFQERKVPAIGLTVKPKETIKPFFEPRGIAVVGVSTSESTKPGHIIFYNLIKLNREDVYAVNPKGGVLEMDGRDIPVYSSIKDIESQVDLAIITVPADAVLPVVEACARKGVKAVILIPGGFSEVDRHREVEDKILSLAGSKDFRVIGPNCLGIIYAGNENKKGINSFFVSEEKFTINFGKESRVALLTQSGALGIIEIENLKNAISPVAIVSYGNQLDVDPCDLVQYFQDDPMVDIIGCYIEGFKAFAGRRFFDIVERSKKPVIAYKAGRTKEGRKATQSHTASIAGEYEVAKAAMKQAGMVVAQTMIDHGDLLKTFALLNGFSVKGNRLVVIANAGYEKTSAADNLGSMKLARFDEATIAKLEVILPPMVLPDPLLDLTPMADDATFEGCIQTVLASDAVDALLVSIVPQSALLHTTDEEIQQNPDNIAARIIRLVHQYKKPTMVSVNVASGTGAIYNDLGKTLDNGGVPTFLTANRAMYCLNAFVRYHMMRQGGDLGEWLK
ncbi:MAG: acetate--CoA ligase family protein [Desulfobacteraceae bacterium]|jgi:acyl-CoA synthetase (NDP forming)